MTSAANQDAFINDGWGRGTGSGAGSWDRSGGGPNGAFNGAYAGPWGSRNDQPRWQPPFWDSLPLRGPMGIVLMVLGFAFYWPVGLAVLIYLFGSGRMSFGGRRQRNGFAWANGNPGWNSWRTWACGSGRAAPSSGNRAFDEYRSETLRRLEDEQKEFGAFLDRLRFARDKAEFDQFMAERRGRPTPPTNGNGEHPAA